MDISNLLEIALEAGASDLHLSTDLPPILRIDGEVQKKIITATGSKPQQACRKGRCKPGHIISNSDLAKS